MAFLGLFKKKVKKVEDSSTPKLTPVQPPEGSIELPKPPQLPQKEVIPSDIPPIKAPETPLNIEPPKLEEIHKPIPPKSMPPITTTDTHHFPKTIKSMPPMTAGGEDIIIHPKVKSFTPPLIKTEETKPFNFSQTPKEKETKPREQHKEELPKFTDVKVQEKVLGHGVSIPTPPHYLSHMDETKEYLTEEGIKLKSLRKPIFVEVNDYRKVIEEIQSIKKDSKKSKELVRSLDEFKFKNSIKIKKWEKELEKIQKDLIFMDKILFEEVGGV